VAICIEARQAKAATGAMPNKTDRNDARGIAQIMRTGWYRAVRVKDPFLPHMASAADRATNGDQQTTRRRERRGGASARSLAKGWHTEPE